MGLTWIDLDFFYFFSILLFNIGVIENWTSKICFNLIFIWLFQSYDPDCDFDGLIQDIF